MAKKIAKKQACEDFKQKSSRIQVFVKDFLCLCRTENVFSKRENTLFSFFFQNGLDFFLMWCILTAYNQAGVAQW